MKLSYKSVLPFAISFLSYLQVTLDELKKNGITIDEEHLQNFVKDKIASWNPQINGMDILDEKTRKYAHLFIAGVALNLMRGKNE
jgi:hypothetical protein